MSGTASITNTFQSQTGDIPLSQLDDNFTDLTDYLNDPTNRNNFALSSGASTYAITLSPAAQGYTAGLEVTWQAASSNTAAVALNVNGLGAVALLYPDSAAISLAGTIMTGGVYKAVYNGSAFIFQGNSTFIPAGATQAQQQTATATAAYVSPNVQQFHPSAAKAWASWGGTYTGTLTNSATGLFASYNVNSVSRLGATWSVALAGAFATSNGYAVLISPAFNADTSTGVIMLTTTRGTAHIILIGRDTNAAEAVPRLVDFVAYGTRS